MYITGTIAVDSYGSINSIHTSIRGFLFTVGFIYFGVSNVYAYKLDLNKCIFMGIVGRIFMIGSILYFYFFLNPNILFPKLLLTFSQSIATLTICFILFYLIKKKFIRNSKEEALIRSEILKIGRTDTYIKLAPLSQNLSIDKSTIIRTVKEMIQKQEIYAEYFRISNKIAFNIIANNAEIDKLMELYHEWEESHFGIKIDKI